MKHTLFAAAGLAACATAQPPPAVPAARQSEPAPVTAAEAQDDTLAGRSMELGLEPATIYFDFDSDTLRDEARSELKQVAQLLADRPGAALSIEGHCDDRGTVEYNIALGERRAKVTRDYLVRLGAPANRLRTISYGEARPAAQGDDEGVWAKNRRSELVPNDGVATR